MSATETYSAILQLLAFQYSNDFTIEDTFCRYLCSVLDKVNDKLTHFGFKGPLVQVKLLKM